MEQPQGSASNSDAAYQACDMKQHAARVSTDKSLSSGVSKRSTAEQVCAEQALAVAREHLEMQSTILTASGTEVNQCAGLEAKLSATEQSLKDAVDKEAVHDELEAETSLESETESTGAESETTSELFASDVAHGALA